MILLAGITLIVLAFSSATMVLQPSDPDETQTSTIPTNNFRATMTYRFRGILYNGSEPVKWSSDFTQSGSRVFQEYQQLVHQKVGVIVTSAREYFGVSLFTINDVQFVERRHLTELYVEFPISAVELRKIEQPLKNIFQWIRGQIMEIQIVKQIEIPLPETLHFDLIIWPRSDSSLLYQTTEIKRSQICQDIKKYLGTDFKASLCGLSSTQANKGQISAMVNVIPEESNSLSNDVFTDRLKLKQFLEATFDENADIQSDWIAVFGDKNLPDSFDEYDKQKTNTILKTYVEVRDVEAIKEIDFQGSITAEIENKLCDLIIQPRFLLERSYVRNVQCRLTEISQTSSLTAEIYFIYPQNMVAQIRVDHNPRDFLYTIKKSIEENRDFTQKWNASITHSRLYQVGVIETVIQLTAKIELTNSPSNDDLKFTYSKSNGNDFPRAECKRTFARLKEGEPRLNQSTRGCWTFVETNETHMTLVQLLFVSWKDLRDSGLYTDNEQLTGPFEKLLVKVPDALDTQTFTFDEIKVSYVNDDSKVPFEGFLMKDKWDDEFRRSDMGKFLFARYYSSLQLKEQLEAGFGNLAEAFKGSTVTKFSPSSDRVKMNGFIVMSQMELIAQYFDLNQVPAYLSQAYENGKPYVPDEYITDIQFGNEPIGNDSANKLDTKESV